MKRIIHLDLKGAPLQVHYIEKLLTTAKSWGATGILLEWEDTFPYSGALKNIGSVNNSSGECLYSMEEVKYILQYAQMIGLDAIQLIQTIGHMEFVLKHPEYSSLREMARSPAVLCPSKPESLVLVKMMLQQALDVQPDAKYLHIGADEVWHTGVCPACQHRASTSEHHTASLYLEHIREIALFLKQQRPELTVLMWDDMLRSISPDIMRAYQLGGLVQPVIWHYNPKECFDIDPLLWINYGQLFPAVWAGSAFKGANGSCQILSPVSRYVSNHEAWMQEFKKHENTVRFSGIILTGWSRFDHFATLCELLPVSLPSLASCLRIIARTENNQEKVVCEELPSCEWPGEGLARCVHSFLVLRDRSVALLHGDIVKTYLNPWQIKQGYTNPIQVDSIANEARQLLPQLSTLEVHLSRYLHETIGLRSAKEWLATFLEPVVSDMTTLYQTANARCNAAAGEKPLPVLS